MIPRIPLTIVTSAGAETREVIVGVMVEELDTLEARDRARGDGIGKLLDLLGPCDYIDSLGACKAHFGQTLCTVHVLRGLE